MKRKGQAASKSLCMGIAKLTPAAFHQFKQDYHNKAWGSIEGAAYSQGTCLLCCPCFCFHSDALTWRFVHCCRCSPSKAFPRLTSTL